MTVPPDDIVRVDMVPADRQERLRQTRLAILQALFDVYPSDMGETDRALDEIRQRAGTMPADEEPLDGSVILSEALKDLRQAGYLRYSARDRLTLTADGMEWLADNRPGTSYGEIAGLAGGILRTTAKLARAIEVLERKQAQIDGSTAKLEKEQKTLEGRLVDADRDVFRRVIPFFALFAAAFAVINASGQAVTRAFYTRGSGRESNGYVLD
jgi:hypothetical protein